MIFKIVDGRSCFYQWDIDRQISVSDPTITEVHFCNRTEACSLVVEVKDGIANVPNKVLQNGYPVRVFGYDGKATLHEATFEVKARTKPIDYIYTETEIKHYEDLERRLDELEENGISEEVIVNTINNYLEENPIDLTGYATEDYVNEAVKNVEVDLSDYATKKYVDDAVSNIGIPEGSDVDLSNYYTKEEVDEAIANIDIPEVPEVDLTNYYTKEEVNGLIPDTSKFITSIPEEYITESELNAKGYLTEHQSLANYSTKEETAQAIQDALNAIGVAEGGAY